MKKDTMSGGASKSGVPQALKRNPNSHGELNSAPDGPHSETLGESGRGGMSGDTSVKHRGKTFHFK